MASQANKDKFRPYLSKDELLLLLSLVTDHRNKLLGYEEMEVTLGARRVLGKIALSIESGLIPSYTTSNIPKISMEDKLGLSSEELSSGKKELSDQQKLERMSKSQQLQHWIDFNKEHFGMEPSAEQLAEVLEAEILEATEQLNKEIML